MPTDPAGQDAADHPDARPRHGRRLIAALALLVIMAGSLYTYRIVTEQRGGAAARAMAALNHEIDAMQREVHATPRAGFGALPDDAIYLDRLARAYTRAADRLPHDASAALLAVADWLRHRSLTIMSLESAVYALDAAGWMRLETIHGVDGFDERIALYRDYRRAVNDMHVAQRRARAELQARLDRRDVNQTLAAELLSMYEADLDAAVATADLYALELRHIDKTLELLILLRDAWTQWKWDAQREAVVFDKLADDEEAAFHALLIELENLDLERAALARRADMPTDTDPGTLHTPANPQDQPEP